jgi:hypothetical protein
MQPKMIGYLIRPLLMREIHGTRTRIRREPNGPGGRERTLRLKLQSKRDGDV